MKLRNKKTGEIGNPRIEYQEIYVDTENHMTHCYKTLRGMFEEWEDYEEPKDFWYIDDFMIMCGQEDEFTTPDLGSFMKKDIEKLKAIGNYFETKEEAEKAVEKLKAWKRLKDKGFRFVGNSSTADGVHTIEYVFDDDIPVEPLDLLFGGEE